MIHKLKAHKNFECSEVYHVAFNGYLNHGDVVIIDMDGAIVMAKVVQSDVLCDGCPFAKGRTCTVRNDSIGKIMCHRHDDTYVGFASLDNILENL